MILLVAAAPAAARKSIFKPLASGWNRGWKVTRLTFFVNAVLSACALSITTKTVLGSWSDEFSTPSSLWHNWSKNFKNVYVLPGYVCGQHFEKRKVNKVSNAIWNDGNWLVLSINSKLEPRNIENKFPV